MLIGCFDVYNIETALPVIDLATIESHLKLVKEDDRRVSNQNDFIRWLKNSPSVPNFELELMSSAMRYLI